MRIAAYRGKSLISKAICWQTRSPYSHIAVMLSEREIVEAWHSPSLVRMIDSLSTGHTPGTKVDIFEIDISSEQSLKLRDFLLSQVGKKYDFGSVLRFLSRRNKDNPEKWFCSELAFSAFRYADLNLLERIEPHQVDPGTFVTTPFARFVKRIIT